jgi:hypothetical protein
MLYTLSRPLKGKSLLKKLGKNLPKISKRQDSQILGGKKENKCYQCGKPGPFKWECPEGKKEEKIIPLMTFE